MFKRRMGKKISSKFKEIHTFSVLLFYEMEKAIPFNDRILKFHLTNFSLRFYFLSFQSPFCVILFKRLRIISINTLLQNTVYAPVDFSSAA